MNDSFPCVAARSAVNKDGMRMGIYRQGTVAERSAALCSNLYAFNEEFDSADERFQTFIAVFPDMACAGEQEFEAFLWNCLQDMHRHDVSKHFDWSGSVASNPDSDDFSFSIGGRAFFIVGLNPHASRLSRRVPWPTIVFNPHEQFERLKTTGKYASMQKAIRSRDVRLQGDINPMLASFGERSEARQYSGRPVGETWTCPFKHLAESNQ